MDRIIANLAIDLRKLATFIRIVKTGSFSAAAASLGISQPTVTQHVQSLERALGHDLFRRHGATGRERDAAGTLLLTPAGEIAAQAAERILAEWQGTVEAIAHLDQESFYVRVGVSSVPGEHLMAGLMRHLKEHHPDAAITVESGDSGTVLQQLADGQ
ncbi:MAG: LysR family transcriptional regulator, partial [Thermaerobacterales bacterium]